MPALRCGFPRGIQGEGKIIKEPAGPLECVVETTTRAALKVRNASANALIWAEYTATSCANRLRHRAVDVLFYPEQPIRMYYVMWKICAELGLRVTAQPSQRTALVLLWKDATLITPADAAPPATSARIINARCRDISKTNVSRHFSAVFGYGYDVEPTEYCGLCVEKSNENARHDGRIVAAPIAMRREGAVYQRLINNIVDHDLVEDIRVPIINGIVPFAYLKYRPAAIRFDSNRNVTVHVRNTNDVLSAQEIRNIAEFARVIGLDYGELDVLRDRDDGRIYILDANKTPWGPSHRLSGPNFRRAVKAMALVFREQFLPGAPKSGGGLV